MGSKLLIENAGERLPNDCQRLRSVDAKLIATGPGHTDGRAASEFLGSRSDGLKAVTLNPTAGKPSVP
jgi:hypothetical protein